MTLTDFLLARIAEDEAAASRGRRHNDRGVYANDNYGCLLVDPYRVLAECGAKRRIVKQALAWSDMAERGAGNRQGANAIGSAVRYLATVYADHPDYRQEWRP